MSFDKIKNRKRATDIENSLRKKSYTTYKIRTISIFAFERKRKRREKQASSKKAEGLVCLIVDFFILCFTVCAEVNQGRSSMGVTDRVSWTQKGPKGPTVENPKLC